MDEAGVSTGKLTFWTLSAVAVGLAGVASSEPGSDLLIGGVAWLALAAVGWAWVRWIRRNLDRRAGAGQLAALIAVAAAFALTSLTDATLWLRFERSKPELTALAQDAVARKPPTAKVQPAFEYVGSYLVKDYTYLPGGSVEVRLEDRSFGTHGFLYRPPGAFFPASSHGESYRPIGGNWYVMAKPPAGGYVRMPHLDGSYEEG
ncbi:MAG: hypothetical protein QOJ50_549 [Cryptosporangiaceae bacterium]|jgi:hypothetical protein|nr:hypothetical protein [Cryptosporangiaceae bacterium]